MSRQPVSLPKLYDNPQDCCGCSACFAICPVQAIDMKQDAEGFFYPTVSSDKCMGCNLCLSICNFKENHKNKRLLPETEIYGCRLKDKDELYQSTSGGAFTALTNEFLRLGHAIICSLYDYKNHRLEYTIIETTEERNKARGSKYIEAFPGSIFNQAEKWLCDNPARDILFVGTGCHAAGFVSFLEEKGLRDRAVIIDLICHGVPSAELWKKFALKLEEKHGKIEYVAFRDKRHGWKQPTAFVNVNGKEIPIKEYAKVYSSRNAMRPSCYICPYTSIERMTDLSIGDFWHIEDTLPERFDKMGTSLVLVHTLRGRELLNNIKNRLEWFESNKNECWQMNLEMPTPMPPSRNTFWEDYKKYGISYLMNKYGRDSIVKRIKKSIKKVISG